MTVTQEQLRNEIGTDYYDQICRAKGYEAREQYEDGDAELGGIRQIRQAMKDLRTVSVDRAIDSLTGDVQDTKLGTKKTAAKGNAIAKGQKEAQEVGSALTSAAKQTKQISKETNFKRGARQAELDKIDQQKGYLHRAAQIEAAGAQVLGQQLIGFDDAIRAQVDEEVDIESVLGGLNVSSPLEESEESEDFTNLGVFAGITFYV